MFPTVAYPGFHFEWYKFNVHYLPDWELVALAAMPLRGTIRGNFWEGRESGV